MALYADIVEIVAPNEEVAGDRVDISTRIRNTYAAPVGIMVGGALEYGVSPWPGISFPEPSANVNGGVIQSFGGYFTMPEKKVTIHVYSYWYGVDHAWHFDDEMTKTVNLVSVPEAQFDSIAILSYSRR